MSNVISSNLLKYKVNKNIDGSLEIPKIFLMSRNLRKRGQIAHIEGLVITPKFTEVNECSFTVYKENNGITLPLFDKIKDNSIIKIEGFGLFQIKVSLHETAVIYKEVTGQCMQACELGQCKCTLEINTDKDTERGDYGEYPTVFYRPTNHPEASLLHRILTYAPTYSIGYVDPSLYNLNRQFSCNDTSVYDFLQDVAKEIGCIFVFSHDDRVINVFDLEDHCTNPDCNGSRHIVNGVCQKCKSSKYIEKGYGLDASTFLDTHNLLEEINDTIDADSIKNCFKLVAGDDTTTNLIGQRLIGNSPYIWTFSDFEIEEFSDELKEKWLSYQPYVDQFQDEFEKQWDIVNDCINQESYWKSGKMPIVDNPTVDTSDPARSCANIYRDITSTITYTAISTKTAVESTVASHVLNYAKLLCPTGYEVKYQVDEQGKKKHSVVKNSDGIITSFTAYLYIYLKNCKDDQDSSRDKYFYQSDAWTIPVKPGYNMINQDGLFTTDYYLYLKQQLDVAYTKADMVYQPKYDTDYDDGVAGHLNDPDYYKNYFKEFSITRLESFKDAYDTCTVTLLEQNASLTEGSDDTKRKYVKLTGVQSAVSLYEDLSGKYIAFSNYIAGIIEEYTNKYNDYVTKQNVAQNKINAINTKCNLKNYLGEALYNELLTFKREDTYENKNYSSDVVDEPTLMSNIEEFIVAAKQEIAKACQPKHEISVKMAQLLTLSDYDTVIDAFAVGNYVRSRINGDKVKMRIISIPIDFTNIEQSDVIFSDSLVGNTQVKNMQEQYQKATSMATSFSFVAKQSERNNEKVNTMSQSISEGLNATKNMIMNSENQDVIMDTHGILGRELDVNTNQYLPEQYRLNNKGLIFTDNNWETIKTALGKIFFNGEWNYGLIAEVLVGKLIAGERLEISDGNRSVVIDKDGITLDGTAIKWKKKLPTSVIDGLDDSLKDFVDAVGDLQSQIDGEITSWFEDYDPTVNNKPASTWETDEDKIKHEGDLFYNTATGRAFRYIYNSSTKNHEWSIITDEAISKALADAATAQDTADRKRRVFTSEPKPPYDIGDLWSQGSEGDIMVCVITKLDGQTYSASDWAKASKYTNDDALNNFIEGDYAEALKDINTQIDGKADTFYQSTKPHEEYTNVENNNTYNLYVGDLWYDTTTGKSYMYTKIANGSNYNYTWKFMDIPSDVYDTIDGIASIYVTIPSNPNTGDLLIPNSDIKSGTKTYYAKKVYKYNGTNWIEINYTDDTAWKNWTSDTGDFGKYKKDIQTQLDGKSKTTYGGSTPPSNPEKGDLWFCTNGSSGYGANKAYMYDGATWKESNGVPDSVWDIADGKSSIFVVKPSKAISSVDSNFYHKNDLWILESDTVLSGHTKGTVMVATSDSTTFNASHWEEKVKYTDDTKANKVDTALNNYKKEISDFQKQVDTQFATAGVTQIGENYVYSPKIASGYLYISKDGCSVQIDPAQSYDTNNSKVINVRSNNSDVFYVGRKGNVYVKADIHATSLTLDSNVSISSSNISGLSTVATSGKYSDLTGNPDLTVYATSTSVDNKLKGYATTGSLNAYLKTNDLSAKLNGLNVAYRGDVTTSQTIDTATGLITTTSSYIGSDGKTHTNKTYTYPDSDYVLLNRENKWGAGSTAGDGKNLVKISKDGLLTANNAIIHGTIYATDGEFTGKVTATSGEFKGAVSIEGNGNIDRMQVHALINSNHYYTRQDYEKFYVGNNEGVANATKGIVCGVNDNIPGSIELTLPSNMLPSIAGWRNGKLYADTVKGFALDTDGLLFEDRNKINSANAYKVQYKLNGIGFYSKNSTILRIKSDSGDISTSGTLSASSISTSGTLSASSISTSGTLSASSISTSGTLSASSISTSGTLSASSISTSNVLATNGESHFSYGTYADPLSGVACGIKCSGGLASDKIYTSELYTSKLHGSSRVDAHVKVVSYNATQGEWYPSTTGVWNCGVSDHKWYAVWSLAYNGASDRKLKTDINTIDSDWAENFIDSLKPSTYRFKDNMYGKIHTGFIAQDVEKSMIELGMKRTDFAGLVKTRKKTEEEREKCTTVEEINYDPDNFEGADENYDYSLRYDDFIAPLVAYCQNLKKKNTELENKLNKIYEKLGLSD